jgi:hypothetical protein
MPEGKGFHAKDAKEEGREGREVHGVVEAVPPALFPAAQPHYSFARRRRDAEKKRFLALRAVGGAYASISAPPRLGANPFLLTLRAFA